MQNGILGISAFYHDSAAVLLIDGKIVAAAHEERFTRKKHDPSFPTHAIRYILNEARVSVNELPVVSFYDKPFLKFERILETSHAFAPKGILNFLSAMPVWMKEKLFMRKIIREELQNLEPDSDLSKIKLLFPEHHLSHAASAFYPSPFEDSAILTIDGVGEWATTTIGMGKGNQISILRELSFPHSIGLLYSAFTYFCGFKVNSGEYKLMGLSPYGVPNSERVKQFKKKIYSEVIDLREDGSLLLNMDYFEYATGQKMCNNRRWHQLFGVSRREPESDLTQVYMDLALAIQEVTEEVVLRLAETARRLTKASNIVLAGGVALNCVANGKLMRSGIFDNLWIQPAAGDAGGALGAALAAYYIWQQNERPSPKSDDSMQGSFLGPEFNRHQIKSMADKYNTSYRLIDDFDSLCGHVAELLDNAKVVGWMQGRMEYGPRALGCRSILADPRKPDMQKKLNLKIKYREGFRPFAPAVLAEDVNDYFDLKQESPYMLIVDQVNNKLCNTVPDNYDELDLMRKLYVERSDLPAITHVDFSARIQTIHKHTNPYFHQLISAFKKITGCAVIVNTSFNVRGEPIVCSPEDAYRCFMRTDMDYLVIGNFIFNKKEQPHWNEKENWLENFELD